MSRGGGRRERPNDAGSGGSFCFRVGGRHGEQCRQPQRRAGDDGRCALGAGRGVCPIPSLLEAGGVVGAALSVVPVLLGLVMLLGLLLSA